MAVMLGFAINDRQDPSYDIHLPRFFLVYVALGFAILSALYGFNEFAKLFLIYRSFELNAEGDTPRVFTRGKIKRAGSNDGGNLNEAMQAS